MLIVDPEMGLWPKDAPDKMEEVVLTFEGARCVKINGKKVSPQEAIREANAIGGRNGIGVSHALENRIIGTKSRGVYEAPGMELLGQALRSERVLEQPRQVLRTEPRQRELSGVIESREARDPLFRDAWTHRPDQKDPVRRDCKCKCEEEASGVVGRGVEILDQQHRRPLRGE